MNKRIVANNNLEILLKRRRLLLIFSLFFTTVYIIITIILLIIFFSNSYLNKSLNILFPIIVIPFTITPLLTHLYQINIEIKALRQANQSLNYT